MHKLILIFLISASCNFYIFPQENKTDSIETGESGYVIFFPSEYTESRIRAELRTWYALIKLRTHPIINLNNDQYRSYSKLIDTIETLNNVTIIDSVSITLKSGISWNLVGNPPPAPKRFYFKALSKKGRKDQAVTDWLKYLQFCYNLEKKRATLEEMVEKFNRYTAIIIGGCCIKAGRITPSASV